MFECLTAVKQWYSGNGTSHHIVENMVLEIDRNFVSEQDVWQNLMAIPADPPDKREICESCTYVLYTMMVK